MPFFTQLRRRSRASFRTTKSTESKSNESQSNGEMTSGKSSSTLETASYSSVTPPSSIKPTVSSPNLPSLSEGNGNVNGTHLPVPPQRPGPQALQGQRNSTVIVCSRPYRDESASKPKADFSCRVAARCLSTARFGRRLHLPLMHLESSPSRRIPGYVLVCSSLSSSCANNPTPKKKKEKKK